MLPGLAAAGTFDRHGGRSQIRPGGFTVTGGMVIADS
jgi:hypothetical protein